MMQKSKIKNQKLKIIFLLFTLYYLLSSVCFAQPSIFLSKTSFDFGDIEEGRIVRDIINIENKGDQDLDIRVRVSCGCVRIVGERNFKISPGEGEKVHFSLDSTGFEGEITHYIFINSNDPENKFLRIPISASVMRRPKDVLERFLSFNLGLIAFAGLIDGVNPCAFTVLVFFISFLGFVGYTKKKMFIVGLTFILAIFITYILIGFGLFEFIRRLEQFFFISHWTSILVSIFAIVLGIISLYDFFIYKKTKDFERIRLKLPIFIKEKIQETIRKKTDIRRSKVLTKDLRLLLSSLSCGFVIALLESLCTGQIYLPTIVYILKTTPYRLQAFGYLLLYNLMFIFPLLVIFYLGLRGITSERFANFARKNLGKVKLITALIFFLLGIGIMVLVGVRPVLFPNSSKVDLVIVEPKDCLTCNIGIDSFIDSLKTVLPDLEIRELNFEDKEAEELISGLRISMLPVYFLNKRIRERKEYPKLENFLIDTQTDYFYFDPSFTGVSYFIGRKRIPQRLDLFISTEIPDLDKILEMIRDLLREVKIDFHLHFLAREREMGRFVSPGGIAEIEEYLRSLCVEKYYKERFFDYFICRAKNIKSSWWEGCAEGLDIDKIKKCALGEEGRDLLRTNIKLTNELDISQAPVLLLFNQEIFGITKDTSVEEIKKFLKN